MKKIIFLTVFASWALACCAHPAGADESPASLSPESVSTASEEDIQTLLTALFREPDNQDLSRKLSVLAK